MTIIYPSELSLIIFYMRETMSQSEREKLAAWKFKEEIADEKVKKLQAQRPDIQEGLEFARARKDLHAKTVDKLQREIDHERSRAEDLLRLRQELNAYTAGGPERQAKNKKNVEEKVTEHLRRADELEGIKSMNEKGLARAEEVVETSTSDIDASEGTGKDLLHGEALEEDKRRDAA